MPIFIKKALFPALCVCSAFIMFLSVTSTPKTTNTNSISSKNTTYILKSYRNSIALYNEEKIIKVYDHVVLNTLPEKDIQNFNKGIPFSTPNQAEIYLLDFE